MYSKELPNSSASLQRGVPWEKGGIEWNPCHHFNQELDVSTLRYLRVTMQKRWIYRSLITSYNAAQRKFRGSTAMGRFRELIPVELSNHWLTLIQEQFHPLWGRCPLWISTEWLRRCMWCSESGDSRPITSGLPAWPTRPPWCLWGTCCVPITHISNQHKSNMLLQGNRASY